MAFKTFPTSSHTFRSATLPGPHATSVYKSEHSPRRVRDGQRSPAYQVARRSELSTDVLFRAREDGEPPSQVPPPAEGPEPQVCGAAKQGAQTPRASGAPTRCRPLAGAAAVLTDQHALLTQ